jgi:hypothetical protein
MWSWRGWRAGSWHALVLKYSTLMQKKHEGTFQLRLFHVAGFPQRLALKVADMHHPLSLNTLPLIILSLHFPTCFRRGKMARRNAIETSAYDISFQTHP